MPNSLEMQIGQRVRRYREAAFMSIDDAADICGVTREKYMDAEAGVRPLSAEELFKLTSRLGIGLKDLFSSLRLKE